MQENEKTTNTLHLRREDIENVKCFYKHKAEMLFYTIIEISAFTAVNAMILRSINEFWHLDVLTLLRIYVFAMYSWIFFNFVHYCVYKAKFFILSKITLSNIQYCVSGNKLIIKNNWFHVKFLICDIYDILPVATLRKNKCILPPNVAEKGNVEIVSDHELQNISFS